MEKEEDTLLVSIVHHHMHCGSQSLGLSRSANP